MNCDSMMIKAVVFDYNGVCTKEGTFEKIVQEYAYRQGKDQQKLSDLVKEYWDLARVGIIESMKFWQSVSLFLEYNPLQLRREWIDAFGFRDELMPKIKALRENGYKIGLLTNGIKDWMEEAITQHNLNSQFDAMVTSYNLGIAKPDPKAFYALTQELNVNPHECIYIDDQTKNITAAEKLGFKAILFTSIHELENELLTFGVYF